MSAPATFRYQLLGAPSITTPAGVLTASKPLVFAAALYLGLNRGRRIPRAHLASLLWPDADDRVRGERQRWLVSQLKRHGFPIASRFAEFELDSASVALDVDALAAAATVGDVLAIAQGDVLLGFEPKLSDAMTRWLDETRDATRANVLRTLERWLAALRRTSRYGDVEQIAHRMLSLDAHHAGAAQALADIRLLRPEASIRVAPMGSAPPSSQLIGRGETLARLLDWLDAAGSSSRLGIAGPAGIGKTRILREFATEARARGAQVVQVRCGRGDRFRPLSLAIDVARELLALRGALGASPDAVEVLRGFTGASTSVDLSSPHEARRAAVYAALSELVSAIGDEGPFAVVMDDAQWAEPGSWSVLGPIFAQDTASPVSWIIAVRADSRDEYARTANVVFPPDGAESEQSRDAIWLQPLGHDDIGALCAARAFPQRIPADVQGQLAANAAGVPFIAEALVDHWRAGGDATSLPRSVSRLVHTRLERLSPAATRVLTAIAILGLDAEYPALEAVATLARPEFMQAIHELDASGIMRTADALLAPHALWTEAILTQTSRSTRQLMHRYAAEWLEHTTAAVEPAEPRRHWAIVAHWVGAGEPAKAQRELDVAADMLAANGFSAEAAQMLEHAAQIAGTSEAALHYLTRAAELNLAETTQARIEAVFRIHARYDEVGQHLHGDVFSKHHDVEMMAHGAYARTNLSLDPVVTRYVQCALDERAPVMHRLRASCQVMYRVAVSGVARTNAERVWVFVASVTPRTEQEQIEYDLCAGSYNLRLAARPDTALVHAHRAHDAILRGTPRTDLRCIFSMNLLADGFEALGDIAAAQAVRSAMLARGQEWKHGKLVEEALGGLIGSALESGDIAEARRLMPLYAIDSAMALHAEGKAIYLAVCALEEGDHKRARLEYTPGLQVALETDECLSRARGLAIYLHIALLERDDATCRDLLPKLLECFSKRMHFMDHPAHVGAMALERFDTGEAAAAFVRDFVTQYRFERWTPRSELMRYLEVPEALSVSAP